MTEKIDRLVLDTDSTIIIQCVRGIGTFRADLKDDIATVGFVPETGVLEESDRCIHAWNCAAYSSDIEILLRLNTWTFSCLSKTNDREKSQNDDGLREHVGKMMLVSSHCSIDDGNIYTCIQISGYATTK